jgi:hypothetical protein
VSKYKPKKREERNGGIKDVWQSFTTNRKKSMDRMSQSIVGTGKRK